MDAISAAAQRRRNEMWDSNDTERNAKWRAAFPRQRGGKGKLLLFYTGLLNALGRF